MPAAPATSAAHVFRIEICAAKPSNDAQLVALLRDAGLHGVQRAEQSRVYFVAGDLDRSDLERLAADLLVDPVSQIARVAENDGQIPATDGVALEVHLRPGVMDPVASSTLTECRAARYKVDDVRTARQFVLHGNIRSDELERSAQRVLANDCIEELVIGTAGVRPAPHAPIARFQLRHVAIRNLNDDALVRLSREGQLFLSLAEMQTIQGQFRRLERDPTDLELETLAQTWSEHCVHKTLKSSVVYRGAPFPAQANGDPTAAPGTNIEARYDNLLKDTITRATRELMAAQRGPECLSVFVDNAGVIGFDERFGVAFKVETHNRPSAIEPYGGAATGVGGCIRDVLGCGLGAKPIANTDVFCVAPGDWPVDELPRGVLHPARVLRGVVRGVADYGNRMGIPTVNGAVHFDARYLGNPLVFCGCIGLIPRDKVAKAAQPGDYVVVAGGRTGRDGIHGATFSSAELTDTHADEFSSAVQIGNAITEKRVLDALLRARDDARGCLYSAVTDCGAGGLSSAVGEMATTIGATVDLERVPLKYAGLRYDEIWISEAQERMVLSVPAAKLDSLLQLMAEEEVEATVIGTFGLTNDAGIPLLRVAYENTVVGELEMPFLHDGLPRRQMAATWSPEAVAAERHAQGATGGAAIARSSESHPSADWWTELRHRLRGPTTASKEWLIRAYDHEVQGGSAVKPLGGPGDGPNDAAVLRPRLDSSRGIAVGCGLTPQLATVDPYWMACNAIDEALRNVVCVGGDPRRTAILDNFCWGRCDDPQTMGALVRACQACHDAALAYGVPFISGKDSLNNEYLLNEADIEALIATLRRLAANGGISPASGISLIEDRIRRTRRLAIPHTLLISAISIVDDVNHCATSDFKAAESSILLIGGLPVVGFDLRDAAMVHAAAADLIRTGAVRACHDVSEGGWAVAVAEMAIAGRRGVTLAADPSLDKTAFSEMAAAFVIEVADASRIEAICSQRHIPVRTLGRVSNDDRFIGGPTGGTIAQLHEAWHG